MGGNKHNKTKKCKTIIIVEIECSNTGLCDSWVETEVKCSVDLQLFWLFVSVCEDVKNNIKKKGKFNRKTN